MNKTKIDWGYDNLYTWNPIVGCKRDCFYCYAKVIHNRFNKTSFSSIIEHPDRFNDPGLSSKNPRTIFVGSMTDIEYWTKEQLQRVVDICYDHIWHTFLFLSKNAYSYTKIKWPPNTELGLTIEGKHSMCFTTNTLMMKDYPNRFLSIEPLLGKCDSSLINNFPKIIVGAMTGPGAVVPKKEWIQSIKDNCPEDRIHWKQNIRPYLNKAGHYEK